MSGRWENALAGGGSGALLGSTFGPVGAAVGGGLGALGGALMPGKKEQFNQLSTLTPEGQQYLQNIFGQLNQMQSPGGNYNQAQNYYSKILSGDSQAYNQFAAPYLQNFEQAIIPMIAERFAGYGGGLGGGAQSSSGLGQALGGAGSQLQAQLASLFANLQQNAAQQATGQYNQLVNFGLNARPFEKIHRPSQLGFGESLASNLSQGFGQALGKSTGLNLSQQIANAISKPGNQGKV